MGDLLKSGIVVSPDKDEGRSMRLGRGRLCYEFASTAAAMTAEEMRELSR